MRNPFEELFNRREHFERRVKTEQQERKQAADLDNARFDTRLHEKQRYDEMVTQLLTQFKDAFNPHLQIYSYNNGWSVGRWDKQTDNSLRLYSVLDVNLVFERDDTAICFEVTRHRKKARAALGYEELAEAVRKLFLD